MRRMLSSDCSAAALRSLIYQCIFDVLGGLASTENAS